MFGSKEEPATFLQPTRQEGPKGKAQREATHYTEGGQRQLSSLQRLRGAATQGQGKAVSTNVLLEGRLTTSLEVQVSAAGEGSKRCCFWRAMLSI